MSDGVLVIEIEQAPHIPSEEVREMVQCMTACGLTPIEIGFVLKLDPIKVLKRHYADEIANGMVACTAKVGGVVYKAALNGDGDLAKFWLRTRAGWREPKEASVKGKDGAVLPADSKIELMDRILSMLTPDQVVEVVRSAAGDAKPAAKGPDKPPGTRAH